MNVARDLAPGWSRANLGDREFRRLAALVYESCGIALTPVKRTMLEGRLRRRLRAHDLSDFGSYLELLDQPAGRKTELQPLIDAVTTNLTAFFREPVHFDYLIDTGIRQLFGSAGSTNLRFWSAASSTGEEPYTIAMVLAGHVAAAGGTGSQVLATDISTEVLATASRGVYRETILDEVPSHCHQYLMRSRDPRAGLVRMVPEIRSKVRFGQLNLIDRSWNVGAPFDAIFCRNVLIYFDTTTQKGVLERLCAQLRPGGLLFLGHADTTSSAKLPLRLLRSNIYERQ